MSSGSTDETFGLDEQTIRELLEALDAKLADRDVAGEVYVVGGSAMLLEYGATRSTNDNPTPPGRPGAGKSRS